MRVLIIDDEELARRGLELRLKTFAQLDIVGFAASGTQAVEAIREFRPDVIFLDIQMPGLDGFGVVAALPHHQLPLVVFVTAYDQYAVKAFDTHAVDYLLKPIDGDRLAECVARLEARWGQNLAASERKLLIGLVSELTGRSPDSVARAVEQGQMDTDSRYVSRLAVKDGRRTVRLEMANIEWIDAAGDYMCIHADGETHVMRGTMKGLEELLNPVNFQRVHRSTIVNVGRVRELRPHMNGEYFLTMDSGAELKLSRHYRDKVALFANRSSG